MLGTRLIVIPAVHGLSHFYYELISLYYCIFVSTVHMMYFRPFGAANLPKVFLDNYYKRVTLIQSDMSPSGCCDDFSQQKGTGFLDLESIIEFRV